MWLISEKQKLLKGTITITKLKCALYKAVYKRTLQLVQTNTLRASPIVLAVWIFRPLFCAGRRETFQPGIKQCISNVFPLIPL
jgi:hypothetical protein